MQPTDNKESGERKEAVSTNVEEVKKTPSATERVWECKPVKRFFAFVIVLVIFFPLFVFVALELTLGLFASNTFSDRLDFDLAVLPSILVINASCSLAFVIRDRGLRHAFFAVFFGCAASALCLLAREGGENPFVTLVIGFGLSLLSALGCLVCYMQMIPDFSNCPHCKGHQFAQVVKVKLDFLSFLGSLVTFPLQASKSLILALIGMGFPSSGIRESMISIPLIRVFTTCKSCGKAF